MTTKQPPPAQPPLDGKTSALLSIYQIERQDQQTSGNQSRALVGTGLAYAAGAAALLNNASSNGAHIDSLLVLAAPLPLIALISLLVLGIGNIQQRARYLVRLEAQLEPRLSIESSDADYKYALTVPNGFRRSEYVFSPRLKDPERPPPDGGASSGMRFIGSIALGLLTHGAMLLTEVGLVAYSVHLADGWHDVLAGSVYGLCIALQAVGWSVALRPGGWEAKADGNASGEREQLE